MSSDTRNQKPSDDLGQVVMDDLRHTRFQRDYWREITDLYYFYLDDERRAALEKMGRVRRAFLVLGWSMKSLLMKLSPQRRLLLLVSLLFMLLGLAIQFEDLPTILGFRLTALDLRPVGYVLLLLVLMLELKDKLAARDEIEIARQVQLALLPRAHPEVPGWTVWSYSRPANDVGGDLVDYVELDGFRHGIVLGDVAGKGLGAALLTAKLQATLRALVPNTVSLDDLGGQLNHIFHQDGLDNRFATLFYTVLEHHAGQVTYLNAGHNPALLFRADRTEKLGASSTPLGMLDSASYDECRLELQSGDMLLTYSDGLTEAQNPDGEDFGVERLEALGPKLRQLDPAAAGQLLLKEVDRFLRDARLTDDLSLVVILKQ